MYHVVYGSDTIAVRRRASELVAELVAQGATASAVDGDTYQPGMLADIAGGISLFGEKYVYILDTPSDAEVMHEEVLASLPLLAASTADFIIIETALTKAVYQHLVTHATAMEHFEATNAIAFNSFAIADALAAKDKKSLWLLLHDARRHGQSDEEIIGTLWWQLKSMRLALVATTASEAGMKEFPFSKAKRSLHKFKQGEIESLSHSLLQLQHDSRLGKRDLDLALEAWVLNV